MKKTRARKPAMPKAVHARPKRKASLPDALPVEEPTNKEPRPAALEVVGDKARRRPHRAARRKEFAGGGGVSGPTPSLAEASRDGWTVDNYPPRHLKHGKIR
jgi:hypothetical protein